MIEQSDEADDITVGGSAKQMKTSWTLERIARLGFLMGLGWTAEEIAKDLIIDSNANNVHRQAQRFGLAFREASSNPLDLQKAATAVFEKAAEKRGLTRYALIKSVLNLLGSDPILLENVIDDEA